MAYQAFMSYSHAADDQLSPAIQAGLYNLARPWYQLRAVRVFRDKTSLSANPHLWSSIEEALGQSEYFILLASTLSAKSPWVQREIQWWLTNRSTSKFIILLSDGELSWDSDTGDFDWNRTTALPPNLRGQFPEEPLYVDFRWWHSANQLSLRHTQFRSAILDIAATIRGVPKDTLDGEDVRRHRQARWLAAGAITIIVGFAIAAGWQAWVANRERKLAVAEAVETGKQRDRAVKGETEAKTQRDMAEERQREAERQSQIAGSRELSVSSLGELNDDPELAMLLAMEAAKVMRTPEAEEAVRQSLLNSHLRRIITSGQGELRNAVFAPDGKSLATTGQNGLVKIWDLSSGKLRFSVPAAVSFVDASFSPNGAFLVTDGSVGAIRVWNAKTGKKVAEIANAVFPVISPDSKLILTTEITKARLYEIETGRQIKDLPGGTGMIERADFSPDGKRVLITNKDKKVIVRDIATGDIVSTMAGLTASFSPDGGMVVTTTTGDENVVRIWFADSGKVFREMPAISDSKAAFDPDGSGLVMIISQKSTVFWSVVPNDIAFELPETGLVFSPDGAFVGNAHGIWSAKTGEKVATLYPPPGEFGTTVAFSPDGRALATGYSDGTARIWATGYQAGLVSLQTGKGIASLPQHIEAVAISPDGLRIAGGTYGGQVALWDRITGHQLWVKPGHGERNIEAIAISPNGKRVVSTGKDNMARLWDMQGNLISILQGHTNWVVDAEFSRDSKLLVTTSYDGTARLWDAATGAFLRTLKGHGNALYCAHFNATASQVVTCDFKSAQIWDASSGKLLRDIAESNIIQASFSSTGQYLATEPNPVIGSPAIHVWNVSSGQKLATIRNAGHAVFGPDQRYLLTFTDRAGQIRDWQANTVKMEFPQAESGEWSTDGLFILTSNKSGQIRIWSTATGNPLMDIPGESETENIAHFSPDGRLILVNSLLGATVYSCDICLSFDEMLALAARRVTRQLSASERALYLHQATTVKDSPKPQKPDLRVSRQASLH